MSTEGRPTVRRRTLVRGGLAVLAVLAVAAIWRLTPARTFLDVERLADLGRVLREHPAAPLLVLSAYIAGALLFFPITVLLAATALAFDPVRGLTYGLAGALTAAVLTFGIGRLIGRLMRRRVGGREQRWLSGARLSRVRDHLQRRGVLAVATARLVPVGNFSLINIAAGAMTIPFRDFLLGNILGLLPGILALTFFANRIQAVLRHPGRRSLLAIAPLLGGAIVIGAAWAIAGAIRRSGGLQPRRQALAPAADKLSTKPPSEQPGDASNGTPDEPSMRRGP